MGMYTYFTFDGIVKPEYREGISKLYELVETSPNTNFSQDVKSIRFEPFYDFITGERADFIFFGAQYEEMVSFDKETGHWHLECDIKDYSEHINPNDYTSPYKKLNSMDLFKLTIPLLFEEENFKMTEHYEEDAIASKYVLKNKELVWTNKKEWTNAQRDMYGYM